MDPSAQLLVCAPLAIEAWALGRGPHVRVFRTGMGAAHARRAASALAREPARAVVVAGFGGALDPSLAAGDVVVASAVSGPDSRCACASDALARALRAAGLRVTVGTIACRDHLVRGEERRALFEQGACAVDMESAWLAVGSSGRPFSVVRAIVDTPSRELTRVFPLLRDGVRGFASLSRVGRAITRFASGARL